MGVQCACTKDFNHKKSIRARPGRASRLNAFPVRASWRTHGKFPITNLHSTLYPSVTNHSEREQLTFLFSTRHLGFQIEPPNPQNGDITRPSARPQSGRVSLAREVQQMRPEPFVARRRSATKTDWDSLSKRSCAQYERQVAQVLFSFLPVFVHPHLNIRREL
jgi:hypothetical protein